jgi:hypothetical protein
MTKRVRIEKVENGYIVEDTALMGLTTIHLDFEDVIFKLKELFGEGKA